MRKYRNWFCVQTNFREDYLAQRSLEEAGFKVELFQFLKFNKRGKGKLFPLFPGYIFVALNSQPWQNVLGVRGVRNFLLTTHDRNKKPSAVPFGMIEELKQRCDEGSIISPGLLVEVIQGESKGYRGIAEMSDKDRALIALKISHGHYSRVMFARDQLKVIS